jgi:hypothetical protein
MTGKEYAKFMSRDAGFDRALEMVREALKQNPDWGHHECLRYVEIFIQIRAEDRKVHETSLVET